MIFAFGAVAAFWVDRRVFLVSWRWYSSSMMGSPPTSVLSSFSSPADLSLSFYQQLYFPFYLFFLFVVRLLCFFLALVSGFRFSLVSFLYDIPVLERKTHLRYISSILFSLCRVMLRCWSSLS